MHGGGEAELVRQTSTTSLNLGRTPSSSSGLTESQKKRFAGRRINKSLTNQNLSGLFDDPIQRNFIVRAIFDDLPWMTPREIPLDLLFFRRVYTRLQRLHGFENRELPNEVLSTSMDRLWDILGEQEHYFDVHHCDVDRSGGCSWSEFAGHWRRNKVVVRLSAAERAFMTIEQPCTCITGVVLSTLLLLLIFVSCLCLMLGTLPEFQKRSCATCEPEQLHFFFALECVCIAVFTAEYIIRVALAPWCRSELHSLDSFLEVLADQQEERLVPSFTMRFFTFVTRPMNVIDLLVVLPWYLDELIGVFSANLMAFRVLRLTRLLRLVKLGRYFDVLNIIVRVFDRSLHALYVLFFYLVLGVCFTSALMFYAEGGRWDPEVEDYVRTLSNGLREPSPFKSIPHSFWWSVVTFTTVGYGDVYPVTLGGRIVAAVTMVVGILVLAMPISVVTLNFGQVWTEFNEETRLSAENEVQDRSIVTQALESLERRTQLLVEIFVGDCETYDLLDFLGEAWLLELPVSSTEKTVVADTIYSLRPNPNKPNSPSVVTGELRLSLVWRPSSKQRKGIHGELEVTVRSAAGLTKPRCKRRGICAVVHCWPRPAPEFCETEWGSGSSTQFRTRLVESNDPVWEEATRFQFDWPEDAAPPDSEEALSPLSPQKPWSPVQHRPLAALADARPAAAAGGSAEDLLRVREAVESQAREMRQLHASVAELREALLRLVASQPTLATRSRSEGAISTPWAAATLPGTPLHVGAPPSGVDGHAAGAGDCWKPTQCI
eukprot:TRINITY_DN17242_c0_g1_i1.p1 TRINITY_DN17242_c0_g1~~TRINITY_DN17242_c0_g1_i1.p1  ORF type:complete len:773 (-),score=127.42 TRINITY_DN17242_c0_g1_i1:107-2425(-)